MASPRNDSVIADLIRAGRLFVCPMHGSVHMLYGRRFITAKGADKDGYIRMKPMVNGRKYELRRCRVIWVYVKGPTPLEIDHQDNERTNDRFGNLAAVTHQENDLRKMERRYALENGMIPEEAMNEEERRPGGSINDDVEF